MIYISTRGLPVLTVIMSSKESNDTIRAKHAFKYLVNPWLGLGSKRKKSVLNFIKKVHTRKKKKKGRGLLEKLASGSMYVLTMWCIVTNSSDRAAAGFWEDSWGSVWGVWGERVWVCVRVFCKPDIPHPLYPQHFCWEECVVRLLRWTAVPTFLTNRKGERGREKKGGLGAKRKRLKMWD